MSESLLVVGLIVPGVAAMFGIGALIGTGVMEFSSAFLWTTLGAIAGDGVSFWIGRLFSSKIEKIWPFVKKPELLENTRQFFLRHGAKSILFGRFVGPVRPIIPAVAGMMNMPGMRFMTVNVASAIVWAPVVLVPGIIFGTSIGIASDVTGRLALIIVIMVLSLWVSYWLAKKTTTAMSPWIASKIDSVYQWSIRHPRVGKMSKQLLDPDYTPGIALFWWLCCLLFFSSIFIWGIHALTVSEEGVFFDQSIFNFLQQARWPRLDKFLIGIYQLGDRVVLAAIVLGFVFIHWKHSDWRMLRYWSLLLGFGYFAYLFLDAVFEISRPLVLDGPGFQENFPAWHAIMPVLVYGFVVIIFSERLSARIRAFLYFIYIILLFMLALSGLVLGGFWFSDVMVGYSFGIAWILVVALVLRRRAHEKIDVKKTGIVTVGIFFGIYTLNLFFQYESDARRFVYEESHIIVSESDWTHRFWRNISPAYRFDLFGRAKQPLTFQWAGSTEEIDKILLTNGWEETLDFNFVNVLRFLAPQIPLKEQSVIPNLYQGREEIRVFRFGKDSDVNSETLIRIWPTQYKLNNGKHIFVGTIEKVEKQIMGFFARRKIVGAFLDPLSYSFTEHVDMMNRVQREQNEFIARDSWDGSVILLGLH
ncbi:MAG: VTT domain-containing protein [Gammaproteobacteria bacterium]|nr:VTT domain-containing protein [Gammaproteobacteria bacterium]